MFAFHYHSDPVAPESEDKYIVFKSQLLELFNQCNRCQEQTTADVTYTSGTLVQVTQTCQHCKLTRTWNNQPYIGNMPVGNLLLAGAILFSGCHPVQTLHMFERFGLAVIAESTFFRTQTNYLQPTIVNVWKDHQQGLVQQLKEEYQGEVVLSGDGRSDSPGHCAKYGSYTVIEQQINKVLDIQHVQVSLVYMCILPGKAKLYYV